MMTFLMFIGMLAALPLHWFQLFHNRRKRELKVQNGEEVGAETATSWRTCFLLLVPTLFDLLATALGAAGLLFLPVSVYQLTRCSVMITTALIKVLIFRDGLTSFQWVGIAVNTVGQWQHTQTIMERSFPRRPAHLSQLPFAL
jgi:drug/metabolite transporter (DMT)-like permease